MADAPPPPAPEGGDSQLRDVGRTVSTEAMTHLKKLRDSERAKEWQGLTLVNFSAQLERFVWDRGCA